MRKSTAAPINWTLSLSSPDKLDQLLHIVEGVIVAADPFAMIDNTRFFVPCKAVQKLRLSVSFTNTVNPYGLILDNNPFLHVDLQS